MDPATSDEGPFPLEIVRIIVEHLCCPQPGYHLALEGERRYAYEVRRYAPVSRIWQQPVEEFTFRAVILTSRDLLNSTAAKILSLYHRLNHVRSIRFMFLLDDIDFALPEGVRSLRSKMQKHAECTARDWSLDWTQPRGISPDTCVQNNDKFLTPEASRNQIFTAALQCLFKLLAKMPERVNPYICLSIEIQPCATLGDTLLRDYNEKSRIRPLVSDPLPCTYLDDLDWTALPNLPMVGHFRTHVESHSVLIKPGLLCQLASRMTRCSFLLIHAGDYESYNGASRVRLREELAAALPLIPSSVRQFTLTYHAMDEFPELRDSGPWGVDDSLSKALSGFFLRDRLRAVRIEAVVTPSIFGLMGEPENPLELNMSRKLGPQKKNWSPGLAAFHLSFPVGGLPEDGFAHYLRMTCIAAQAATRLPSSMAFSLHFPKLLWLECGNEELKLSCLEGPDNHFIRHGLDQKAVTTAFHEARYRAIEE